MDSKNKGISIEEADNNVVNALYKKALSGDTRAIIFWLCNRQPDKWNQKPVAVTEEDLKQYGIVLMPARGDHDGSSTEETEE